MIFDIFILSPWMCLCWCQALRTQEAAHAEAEEREDLEIAAEVAGIELNHVRKFLKWCFSPWLCNSLKKENNLHDRYLYYGRQVCDRMVFFEMIIKSL